MPGFGGRTGKLNRLNPLGYAKDSAPVEPAQADAQAKGEPLGEAPTALGETHPSAPAAADRGNAVLMAAAVPAWGDGERGPGLAGGGPGPMERRGEQAVPDVERLSMLGRAVALRLFWLDNTGPATECAAVVGANRHTESNCETGSG